MTGHYYFAMLNEVEQEQYKENFINCRLSDDNFDEFMDEDWDDFNMFVSCGFIFDNTNEGRDYWMAIRDSQRDGVDANPKSMKEFIDKIVNMALSLEDRESETSEPNESLEDVLSNLKIKLSDEQV